MARPSNKLRGKVAVVTGGTRGLGLLIAGSLAQAGAQIAIGGRQMEQIEAVYQQLSGIPGLQVLGVDCDVRERAQVEMLAARTVERFGALDIWVNNAAIAGPPGRTAEVPPEAWQAVIESNLIGTFHGTQVALKQMLSQCGGKIINVVGSGAHDALPYLSAYATSKAAILRFTESVAAEYEGSGISLFALSPGPVETTLFQQANPLSDEAAREVARLQGEAERSGIERVEVSELAVHLASSESDGINGKLYEVRSSGGFLSKLFGR